MAAKRHYGSKKAPHHKSHHSGMVEGDASIVHASSKSWYGGHGMKEGAVSEGHYVGPEARRKQEMMDGSMIREDHAAVSNLPQNVMYHTWPGSHIYMPEGLDDTAHGIDMQRDLDGKRFHERMVPKKV
jgi:hypothetical protein